MHTIACNISMLAASRAANNEQLAGNNGSSQVDSSISHNCPTKCFKQSSQKQGYRQCRALRGFRFQADWQLRTERSGKLLISHQANRFPTTRSLEGETCLPPPASGLPPGAHGEIRSGFWTKLLPLTRHDASRANSTCARQEQRSRLHK